MLYPLEGTAYAIVAQLDRAFGSDPEGQRFESSRSHQRTAAQVLCGGPFLYEKQIFPEAQNAKPGGKHTTFPAKASPEKRGTNFYGIHLAKAALCLIIEAVPRCARARCLGKRKKRI